MFKVTPKKYFSFRAALFAVLPMVASLTACADSMTSPALGDREVPPAEYTQKLECTAQVHTGSVSCAPIGAVSHSSLPGMRTSRSLRPIVLGGQGTYVQLTSSNVAYDGGTQQFSFDVTVQNLIPQPLGMTSAGQVDVNRVRVFFAQSPIATTLADPMGSSSISVQNPDGLGTFTASNQPYYQYNENGIVQGAVSQPKTWIFTIDPNVQTFSFIVYVSTSVQYPDGYITDMPYVLILDPGEVFVMDPVVHRATGVEIADAIITYNNDNPGLLTVAADGTATAGLSRGFATISLLSGTRPGTHTTAVSVCQSTVVTNGTALPSSISSSDCFSSVGSPEGRPTTSYYGDLYRVSLTAGQTITITMDSGDDLDTYLLLADRFGLLVAGNDDDDEGVLGVGSRIVYTATTTGTYTIESSTFNGLDQGNYTLSISIQ